MTIVDAKKYVDNFFDIKNPTNDEEILFVESLKYLIDNTGDKKYMTELGGFYYEKKKFDLAEKYYLLAANLGEPYAANGLGYIYYYGRCGVVDYKKAFHYYSLAKGVDEATLKISDMYKNGYGVEKNLKKSKEILLELYEKNKAQKNVFSKIPEIELRLSNYYIEEKNYEVAIELLDHARFYIKNRLYYNPFFGDFTNMNSIIENIFKCVDFDKDYMDIYDILYYFKKPGRVRFIYEGNDYEIIGELDGECVAINFLNKWYRNPDEFIRNAKIDNKRLSSLAFEIYDVMGE